MKKKTKLPRTYRFIAVNDVFETDDFGKLIVVETLTCQCTGCVFNNSKECINRTYACTSGRRKDEKSVIFRKFQL